MVTYDPINGVPELGKITERPPIDSGISQIQLTLSRTPASPKLQLAAAFATHNNPVRKGGNSLREEGDW